MSAGKEKKKYLMLVRNVDYLDPNCKRSFYCEFDTKRERKIAYDELSKIPRKVPETDRELELECSYDKAVYKYEYPEIKYKYVITFPTERELPPPKRRGS